MIVCWKLPLFLIVANDNQVNYSVILFIMWFSMLTSVKELKTEVGSFLYQCVCCKAICVIHNPCVCISQLTLIWNVGMKSILFL
jgi:hypothetical protein